MDNRDFLAQMILKVDPEIDDAGLEMMISDAEPVLQEWIYTNIVAKLDENGRKELVKLSGKDKILDGEVYNFLSKKFPGYEGFIQGVYEKFEDMYKTNYKNFRG